MRGYRGHFATTELVSVEQSLVGYRARLPLPFSFPIVCDATLADRLALHPLKAGGGGQARIQRFAMVIRAS